jgi:hypothetical protein
MYPISPISYDIATIEAAERQREGARQRQAAEVRQYARQDRAASRNRITRFPIIRLIISRRETA